MYDYNKPPPPVYFCGLDLGQTQDFTALTVLERTTDVVPPTNEYPPPPEPPPVYRYACRHLERFRLGTSYPAICDRMVNLCSTAPLVNCMLAVDQTGVGRAVVDLLRRAQPQAQLRPITITGGEAVTWTSDSQHVPKRDLVSALQVVLQTRRLNIAKGLPEAVTLIRELEAFRVKITLSANETFEAWRERDHDDLVLATAMAVWLSERGTRTLKIWT